MVNAATNPVLGPLLEIEPDTWRKILDVNLTGAMLTARAAVQRMLPRQRGVVLFMASVAGIDPMPGLGAYSVSKAGLLGLTKVLAKELGPKGIRVNALAPGLVETRVSRPPCSRTGRLMRRSWPRCRWAGTVSRPTSREQRGSWPPMPRATSPGKCWSSTAVAGCKGRLEKRVRLRYRCGAGFAACGLAGSSKTTWLSRKRLWEGPL